MPAPGGDLWLLLNTNEDGMAAVSLADGRPQWTAPCVLKMRSVSSPIVASGLILGTCGSGGGGNYLVTVRPPGRASDAPRVVYEIRRSAPYVPTPVASGGLVFLWSDAGIASCVESASGQVIWQERVGGDFFASPVIADGKLINQSTRGEVVVLAAQREYRLLGRNPLGEPGNASPAVANGRLYLRTASQVFAITSRNPQ
jgi:outer membrane protein assembly factor BamB